MPEVIRFLPTGQPPTCQACGYQLSGLIDPRCPECGKPFDPRDPATYTHPKFGWGFFQWLAGLALAAAVGYVIATIPSNPFGFFINDWRFTVPVFIVVGFWCRPWTTIGWSVLGWAIAVSILVFAVFFCSPHPNDELRNWDLNAFLTIGVAAIIAACVWLGHGFRRLIEPRRATNSATAIVPRWYGSCLLSVPIVLVFTILTVLPSLGS